LLGRERELWAEGFERVSGVDEAGMGPLAGPVVAAAVIFRPGEGLRGVHDSKRLTPARRKELDGEIRRTALAYSVVRVDVGEIDSLNIYRAGLEAMRRAVEGLEPGPDFVLVDGRRIPGVDAPREVVIKGDAKCNAIAVASILAKRERDVLMEPYDAEYPGYDFASHKGYATSAHREAIRRLGPSPIHRRSFTLLPHPKLWD
jgi:ribonuclease HII